MNPVRSSFVLSCILLAAPVLAHERAPAPPSTRASLTERLAATSPSAALRDRFLLGTGHEARSRLANGNLRLHRVKRYTHVEHPETREVAWLPEPCRAESVIELTSELRMVRMSEKVFVPRSIDKVFDDYAFTEEHEDLFAWDEARVHANTAGTHLTRTLLRRGRTLEETSYAYERDDVPVEILGIALARAVARGARHFEFDLLMPDGATHQVSSEVHHASDLRPFVTEYRFPSSIRRRLTLGTEAAVLELELASPVKRLLYPYKFYLAYAAAFPSDPLAFWGGKPGSHLYAFRTDSE